MMRVRPDWTHSIQTTSGLKAFLAQLGHTYNGPGFYQGRKAFLIVVPVSGEREVTRDNVWHVDQPECMSYDVVVFECPFEETIYGAASFIPTRT